MLAAVVVVDVVGGGGCCCGRWWLTCQLRVACSKGGQSCFLDPDLFVTLQARQLEVPFTLLLTVHVPPGRNTTIHALMQGFPRLADKEHHGTCTNYQGPPNVHRCLSQTCGKVRLLEPMPCIESRFCCLFSVRQKKDQHAHGCNLHPAQALEVLLSNEHQTPQATLFVTTVALGPN